MGYMYIADDYYNLHEVDFAIESIIGIIKVKQTFGDIDNNAWLPISHHYEINGKFMGNEGDMLYISSVKYSNVKINANLKTPSNITKLQQPHKITSTQPKKPTKSSDKQQIKEQKNAEKLEKLLSKEALSNREMYELAKLMDKQAKKADTTSQSLEVVPPVKVKVDTSATKADSTQWKEIRPVILTAEEIKIDNAINLKNRHEKDSTNNDTLKQKRDNLLVSTLTGYAWRNKEKKQTIYFSGLLSPNEFRFNTVDGFVAGSSLSYSRTFPSTTLHIKPSIYYAFSRKTPMGTLTSSVTYANRNRGLVGLNLGLTSADFNQITGIKNFTNTIASLGFGRNYMKLFENRYISVFNRIDPINGLEVYTEATFSNRQILDNNTDFILVSQNKDWYTPNTPTNNLISSNNLNDNKALLGTIRISYTPFYHYRISENRKIMLYSKYPTIRLQTKIGIPGAMGSNSDFINYEASIKQTINIGPSNQFSYNLIYGDFLTKNNLPFNDFTHFNTQILPVTARQFHNSYQGLSYYKHSTNSTYAQGFASYQTPYLLLKYLPFLSNRMWQENIHFASLFTRQSKPYYEFGYSMSQIGAVASLGIFTGFKGQSFYCMHIKLSITLNNIEL
mgnify:CR=1 FL=1